VGTEKLLKVLLGGALALLAFAPAFADEINYIESEEGNPELQSEAAPSGELELPLLPPIPLEEPAPVEETAAPEPAAVPAEEISAPVEEPLLEPQVEEAVVEIPVPPAEEELPTPETVSETTAPVEVEATAEVTAEVTAAHVTVEPGADYAAQLQAAGDKLYAGDNIGAVAAFEAIVSAEDVDPELYSRAVSGYAAALRAAGRKSDAEQQYQEALTFSPDDADLRLAYAYTLAENDKLDRALYQLDILERATPGSDSVSLARARAYAWSGQFDEALLNYSTVTDPALANDALLGTAYVLYWQGKEDEARAMLGTVNLPGNKDVDELYALLGPEHTGDEHYGTFEYEEDENASLTIAHRNREDSQDNSYSGTTALLNIPLGPRGSSIFISHEDFDLDNEPDSLTSSGTNTRVGFTAQLDDKTTIRGYAGSVSIDNSGAQTIDHTDIGAALSGRFSCDWTYNIAYTDDLMYDSPALARAGVSLQNIAVSTRFGVLDDNTTLELLYETGELSDGNSRTGYGFDLRHTDCYECKGELAWGLRGRDLASDDSSGRDYFTSDKYQLAELYLDWVDHSDNDLKFDAGIGVGMQKIGSLGDWQNTLRYALGVRAAVSNNFMLRAGFGSSDLPTDAYIVEDSPDYSQDTWYLSGEWEF
jgi:Flp pilus assembly protein TadD